MTQLDAQTERRKMSGSNLTIKELTTAVGGGITPRMVRHYHQVGLLPQPLRSPGNYRLYTKSDVQRLKRIVALKQQGFQLAHIQKLLETDASHHAPETLLSQLQQQYQSVIQQMTQLRHTASALERLLGRDRSCQATQAEALARLKQLEVETQTHLHPFEELLNGLDTEVDAHPEAFQESLQWLLPDLGDRSEIEADLLAQLVLACGDVSLVTFVRLGKGAIAASRAALKAGCAIVTDVSMVSAALDQTRLRHLHCEVTTLVDDPHITSVPEAEQAFWQQQTWKEKLHHCPQNSILVIGYAPSILLSVCQAIQQQIIQPALVIGMPIGFSHAPIAKRQLMRSGVPYLTIEGAIGGGMLAATALNTLMESLIEKPNCHCYLKD
ncbi:MAG: precorrin-8X methylmutase [Oculatellaceae cyanobacterium Prado106]|jgi:precorrin-8X/cobalt-precorrin-8 methylmutase|nr:precorrin-8X methylmutase [Oculatellaceae cyanobacterium Prado106]